jgi:hypothetical protein
MTAGPLPMLVTALPLSYDGRGRRRSLSLAVVPTVLCAASESQRRSPHRGRQAEPLWASGRHGYLGRLPPRPQGLGAGGTALGRHRPCHRALACSPGQERGCQRASDIGAGKPRAAQAPARSANVPIRLHLGAPRSVVRSRISAHGCQGRRGGEIHVPRAFPHAAACLRVQARQRRARHSRHPSLSRALIDHVHGALHGLDPEPIQELLEGLTFKVSYQKTQSDQ